MSNAAKHRKKAAEFEQLKQIDRAISAYIKSIEESESAGEDVDVALFNKVGDLALRQGRVPDAITYYERAVEHYATSGLFNNAIALCNKILRSAPGRSNVYFTLGRICARKGLRGDATRNFLEYATRMREEGRVEEGMRALAEIADLSPELVEVRKLVDEYAHRAGITLPRRLTPAVAPKAVEDGAPRPPAREEKSQDLVFIQVDYGHDDQAKRARRGKTPMRHKTPVKAKAADDALARAIIEPGPGVQMLRDLAPVATATPPEPAPVAAVVETPTESDAVTANALASVLAPTGDALDAFVVPPVDGLEADLSATPSPDVPALEGLTVDETPDRAIDAIVPPPVDGMPLVPHDLEVTAFGQVELLDDVVVEDYEHAADDPRIAAIIATEAPATPDLIVVDPTPLATAAIVDAIPPLDVESVPELDEAIADGAAAAEAYEAAPVELTWLEVPDVVAEHETAPAVASSDAVAEPVVEDAVAEVTVDAVADVATDVAADGAVDITVDSTVESGVEPAALVHPTPEGGVARITPLMLEFDLDTVAEHAPPTRPPFRVDPHDFILPGELPPLLLDDAVVDAGLRGVVTEFTPALSRDAVRELAPVEVAPASGLAADQPLEPAADDLADADDELLDVGAELAAMSRSTLPADASSAERLDQLDEKEEQGSRAGVTVGNVAPPPLPSAADFDAAADALEPVSPSAPPAARPVVPTPALPIAAVAAEATIVATSRRDALRAAVSRLPQNWMLRRRLAEALFESGERDEALAELETARQGFVSVGDLSSAADIADEMVHVSPEKVAFHQRRVELAVTMHDLQRLRMAYLDLADALVRMGEEGRARAVYARVLEIDPLDDRARTALGAAAPPPPPPAHRPDDDFVDLTTWLKDDEGPAGDTRLRMREPVISGDEQADFDELLRHFKEGVARSLGEDDFESHYDLGVAYKEMGLLDDAIAEFQKALRSHGNRLPAYEALGQCFVEQERHQVAATVLTRALHEPGLGDEQRVGVLYLLAFSCEALQRFDEARSYYQRVYAIDIEFRDAAARLAALEHIAR